jgi:hypothetical protein
MGAIVPASMPMHAAKSCRLLLLLALAIPLPSAAQTNSQLLNQADSTKFAATFAQPDSTANRQTSQGMSGKRTFWVGTALIVGFGLAAFMLYNVRSK